MNILSLVFYKKKRNSFSLVVALLDSVKNVLIFPALSLSLSLWGDDIDHSFTSSGLRKKKETTCSTCHIKRSPNKIVSQRAQNNAHKPHPSYLFLFFFFSISSSPSNHPSWNPYTLTPPFSSSPRVLFQIYLRKHKTQTKKNMIKCWPKHKNKNKMPRREEEKKIICDSLLVLTVSLASVLVR